MEYPLQLTTSPQIIPVSGGNFGTHTVTLAFFTNTGSGNVDADYFLTWAEVHPDLPR